MASIKMIPIQDKAIPTSLRVSKRLSKKLTNSKGETVYYIERDLGLRRGLLNKMDFKNVYPMDNKFVKVNIELIRK